MKLRHRIPAVTVTALLLASGPAFADRSAIEANYDPVGSMLYLYPRDEVRQAQAELKALGYYLGDVDGRMSDRVEAALRTFQREVGLATNGRLDASTSAALSDSAPAASP
jgi:peptidoglycan hydrolase-like protein with peptidoglycan-binding domain